MSISPLSGRNNFAVTDVMFARLGTDLPFVVVAETVFGPMILHRLDDAQGLPAIRHGRPLAFDEIRMLSVVAQRLPSRPVFLDIGANVGFFTVALARTFGTEGKVYAFEGQPVIFNMLAGSVALNGLTNVVCINACVGSEHGKMEVPAYDYRRPLNFGSVEFGSSQKEQLTQSRSTHGDRTFVALTTIDSQDLESVSIMKIDVEGMELDVIAGAANTIKRFKPILFVEYLKCGLEPLQRCLAGLGYRTYDAGGFNIFAIPSDGPNAPASEDDFLDGVLRPPRGVPRGFNATVYLACNSDVRAAGVDPETHYLEHGWREGRNYRL